MRLSLRSPAFRAASVCIARRRTVGRATALERGRPIAFAAGLVALCGPLAAAASAQSLPDPIVSAGEVRVAGGGQYHSWRERFGLDGQREPLATDLTRESAAALFPGVAQLETALQGLLDASFPVRLGPSTASVAHNEVRVPLSVDVGVLDRLTVGVTVPLVRTTLEADLRVGPDAAADLGVNPAVATAEAVSAYVDSLAARMGQAQTRVSGICAPDPGSPECAAATAVADDLARVTPLLTAAYAASGLFPAAGTPVGDAIVAWFTSLDAQLTAQGLVGVGTPPLAASVAGASDIQGLLAAPLGPFAAAPIASFGSRWGLGDVEARVAGRLLRGARADSAGVPTLAWDVAAVGIVRLPTGARDSAELFLDRGRDDGQTDLEAAAYASIATRRWAVRARATWTIQRATRIETRVAPYGEVISGHDDVASVDWDPGDGYAIEVEPAFRLAPALSLAASWRFVHRGGDRFERAGAVPQPPTPGSPLPSGLYYPDATVLDVGTGGSLHELGGSITYHSTGLPETAEGGFEAFFHVRQAIAGSGGRVPAGLRAEFGLRLLRRLWNR